MARAPSPSRAFVTSVAINHERRERIRVGLPGSLPFHSSASKELTQCEQTFVREPKDFPAPSPKVEGWAELESQYRQLNLIGS